MAKRSSGSRARREAAPSSTEQALMAQLTQLIQWAEEEYGVVLDVPPEGPGPGRSIGYHLHAEDGTCRAEETFVDGFGSIAEALAAGLDDAIDEIAEESALEQYLQGHAQLVAAGLSVFPEDVSLDASPDDQEIYEGHWGYCWDCGCAAGGFSDEQTALTAALMHHREQPATHQHPVSPPRTLVSTA